MCINMPINNDNDIDIMPPLIPIYYNPAGFDCTISVYNFSINESSFYPIIMQYSSILHHKINGQIVSTCMLDYGVIETMRNEHTTNIYYPTIQSWIDGYSGETRTSKYVLDNVFMGNTSLWEIIDID